MGIDKKGVKSGKAQRRGSHRDGKREGVLETRGGPSFKEEAVVGWMGAAHQSGSGGHY